MTSIFKSADLADLDYLLTGWPGHLCFTR